MTPGTFSKTGLPSALTTIIVPAAMTDGIASVTHRKRFPQVALCQRNGIVLSDPDDALAEQERKSVDFAGADFLDALALRRSQGIHKGMRVSIPDVCFPRPGRDRQDVPDILPARKPHALSRDLEGQGFRRQQRGV
jgi:hypothetical protein